jgi:uncharacterized protein YceH (UPF0502 family)
MEPLPDLATLQAHLDALSARNLVVYLSPPGQKRGVMVTHGLYPPDELEKVRRLAAQSASAMAEDDATPARSSSRSESSAAWQAEAAALRAEVDDLRGRLDTLAGELRDLRNALGA